MTNQIIKYSYKTVPTLRRFSESNAFFRLALGPFGSGKSSASVIELISRAQAQKPGPDGVRRTRWIVIRNTYRQLHDSTIKTFFQWLPPHQFGDFKQSTMEYRIKAFDNLDCEVLFRALDRPDHVGNLLSLEVTGGWLNEMRECPWQIVDALQGRVGRYPSKREGGPSWWGLWGDSNPADTESKMYKYFVETDHNPEHAALFMQPDGLGPDAENLDNLPGGRRYYEQMAVGKDPEWVKVYCRGQWGYTIDGKPVYPEYHDETHCKEIKPTKYSTLYRGWDFGLCYDDQTEVLTHGGWKFFKDVDEHRDLAATRNPTTGKLEYTKINFKIARPYKGKMLEWSNREINFCVTPEHRIPYTNRGTPHIPRVAEASYLAAHMTGHHYVDLCSKWEGKVDLANYWGMTPDTYAEFLGIFLSEGHTHKKRIGVSQKKHVGVFGEILARTGLDWRWKDPGNGAATGWRLYHPKFASYLSQFGKSRVRRVPQEIKDMPSELLVKFIDAYTLGDGNRNTHKNGSIEHVVFSTSSGMMGDLQEIAQKIGWHSSIRWIKPFNSTLKCGRVIHNTGIWCISFKKRAQRAELLQEAFRELDYDGYIYCLNVPYHTLYVRRGGKAHWNGNTPCCVFAQMLPSGQLAVLDELCTEDMGIDQFSDEVIAYTSEKYGDFEIRDVGDPAGEQRSQTDTRSVFQILHSKGILIEGGMQTLALRLECVKKPLLRMVMGKPGFVMSPKCKQLRKGFMGGYCFRRLMVTTERFTNLPDKNKFSHPHDALQYICTILFGGGLTSPYSGSRGEERSGPSDFDVSDRSNITGY